MKAINSFSILLFFLFAPSEVVFSQSSPILIDIPEALELECGQALPPPAVVGAEPDDDCGEIDFSFSEYHLCIDYKVYALEDPSATDPGIVISGSGQFNWAEGARLFTNTEQAFVVGDVVDRDDPSRRYEVFLKLESGRLWEEWSSLLTTDNTTFRTYKDFSGLAFASGSEPWMDWRYYEVDEENSQMTGKDGLSGSSNRMLHIPANRVFAFQVGEFANGLDTELGMSVWSGGEGFVQGVYATLLNSVYADITLIGTVGELHCDDVVLRTWTASNECDLRSTGTQLITTSGGSFPADIDDDGSYGVGDFISLNSAFGGACEACAADVDNDGQVDVLDFLEFNSAFGSVCD